jgi:signal peptidase I
MNFFKTKILSTIKFTSGSVILLSVIDRFLISFRKVEELISMSPSFNPKHMTDYILIWKLDYPNKLKNKSIPQLTFMNHPFDENFQVVRFVTGFSGEWIKDKNKEVYHKIPEGFCWVECLNGDDDSNTWGPVPMSLFLGRPLLKIRPFRKFVTAEKIEKNIYKKLKVEERLLSEDNINSFFL